MEFKIPLPELTREEASTIYLRHGGVLKIEEDRLLYPDKKRVDQQLLLAEKKLSYLEPLISELEKRKSNLSTYNILNAVKRGSDSLFWKHYYRKIINEEYRKASGIVVPPIHRINEEKYRKIMKQFLENENYRKNMYEAKTSIINEGTLSESIEKNINESRKLVDLRLNKLRKEKAVAFEKKRALMVFLDWVD